MQKGSGDFIFGSRLWQKLPSRAYQSGLSLAPGGGCLLGYPDRNSIPQHATGVLWGKRNIETASTCGSGDCGALLSLFQNLKKDAGWRNKLAAGAVELSRKEFDPKKIKARFMNIISSI